MESDIPTANRTLICTLPDDEFASRRKEVRQFVGQAKDVQSLPDGLRYTFMSDKKTAHLLTDFILFEMKCCSDLTYELRSLPPHSQLVLELHAPREFLDALRSFYLEDHSKTAAPRYCFVHHIRTLQVWRAFVAVVPLSGQSCVRYLHWASHGDGIFGSARNVLPS